MTQENPAGIKVNVEKRRYVRDENQRPLEVVEITQFSHEPKRHRLSEEQKNQQWMQNIRQRAQESIDDQLHQFSAREIFARLTKELEEFYAQTDTVEESQVQNTKTGRIEEETAQKIDIVTDILARETITKKLFEDSLDSVRKYYRKRYNALMKKINLEEPSDQKAEVVHKTKILLLEKQMKLIDEMLENKEQAKKDFLKMTNVLGGSHETTFKKEQFIEEKKYVALQNQLEQTKGQYDKLSFFQRMFGEGPFLKKRLERIRAQIDIVKPKVAEQRLYEPIRHAGRFARGEQEEGEPKELTTAKHIENPWQLYQARLAELDSWQSKRKKLSWLPWKDRAEKQRIDEFIAVIEKEVVQSKELYEKDVRERSLERDAQTIQREKEHFTKTG